MSSEGMAQPGEEEQIRVTAREREAAEARLQQATGAGALTLDEFAERMGALLAARTRGDLAKVVGDLPAVASAPPARPRRPARRWVIAILGSANTRGRWRPADNTTALALLGGVEVDLREAEVDEDVLNLNAVAVMGGVEITVPEGVEVEMSGLALMGGRDNAVRAPAVPGAPVVHVRAFALMGGVDVRNPKPEKGTVRKQVSAGLPMRAPEHQAGAVGFAATGPAALPDLAPERRPARSEGARRWVGRAIVAAALALFTSPIWTSDGGALSVFGSQQYQVSQRALSDGEETVYGVPLFGSVEIVVPDGVAVEAGGPVLFGSRDCPACQDEAPASAPVVRVRTFGGFGSVEIVRAGQEERDR